MEKLTTLTGVGVPLRRSNVDTDQIIPAVFLKRVTKSGFDDALFYAWRRDPNFVLNKPEYAGKGQILVAGPEFGIGSSREHAVWALQRLRALASDERLRRYRSDAAARGRHRRLRKDARRKVPLQAQDHPRQTLGRRKNRVRPRA